jgi:hypothetical protein
MAIVSGKGYSFREWLSFQGKAIVSGNGYRFREWFLLNIFL